MKSAASLLIFGLASLAGIAGSWLLSAAAMFGQADVETIDLTLTLAVTALFFGTILPKLLEMWRTRKAPADDLSRQIDAAIEARDQKEHLARTIAELQTAIAELNTWRTEHGKHCPHDSE